MHVLQGDWIRTVSMENWARAAVICFGFSVAHKLGFASAYLMLVAIYLIYCNLSDGDKTGPSAYSVFNRGQALPGQLQAEQLIPGQQ